VVERKEVQNRGGTPRLVRKEDDSKVNVEVIEVAASPRSETVI
jgi:hypothetical protein